MPSGSNSRIRMLIKMLWTVITTPISLIWRAKISIWTVGIEKSMVPFVVLLLSPWFKGWLTISNRSAYSLFAISWSLLKIGNLKNEVYPPNASNFQNWPMVSFYLSMFLKVDRLSIIRMRSQQFYIQVLIFKAQIPISKQLFSPPLFLPTYFPTTIPYLHT